MQKITGFDVKKEIKNELSGWWKEKEDRDGEDYLEKIGCVCC